MKSGSTLILVRHGETEGQSSIRYFGSTDVPLSELGRAQMKATREALVRRHGAPTFDAAFASPLSRARESAQIICEGRPAIVAIKELVEIDFGMFEGLTAEEIRARHPDEFERWNRDRFSVDYAYPGGESRAAFEARVRRGVDRLLEAWDARAQSERGCALVVAHRGVVRAIARLLAGVQPLVELGSIQILRRDGAWRAHILDATEHLASP